MPRSSSHPVVAPVCLALGLLLSAHTVDAQTPEIPRTATLPGLPSPAFPYAEPEEVGLSSEKLAQLGDEIVEWVANGELVGAELLIVKDGRAVFHEAYGWSDREEGRPMERGSLFSIKSMSKPFTATAILMLAEEGELSLDDPVSRYVPTFAGDERTTVRHLLAHTSGYEGWASTSMASTRSSGGSRTGRRGRLSGPSEHSVTPTSTTPPSAASSSLSRA